MMEDKRTARMTTSREARKQILKKKARELVADSRELRRRQLELRRNEMILKDRIIQSMRQELEQRTPTSPERGDMGTQIGETASGSVGEAPAQPTAPPPGSSG